MKYIFLLISILVSRMALAQYADLVLTNANIITIKLSGDRANAVAIKGDKIMAVGRMDTIALLIGSDTRVIDVQGKTIVPGFNDVHQHPAPVYSWEKLYASLELDTVSSMQNLITLLKRKAAVTPKGMLIRGFGYNEVMLGRQPTRDELDKASMDHPILLTHASGHLSAANSFLLNSNHINQTVPDPPGGALERDQNGIPDGIIKESARKLLDSKNIILPPEPTPSEEMEGYKIYFNSLLASGLTSIGDCWTTPEKVKIYENLASEHYPMRFNLYIGVDYLDQVISGEIKRQHTDYLRIDGIKIFHGNSLSGKTCWLYEPYDMTNPATGKKDYFGIPPARNQQSLDSLVLKIHRAGLQIACHSNGDREIDMVIAAIERAQKTDYRPNVRHRIEHCSIVNQEIMEKIKRDSIVPVFHCYINQLGPQLAVYGSKRLSMLIPTETALNMDIPFALHSDYPISRYEPMIRLASAVNRKTKEGVVLGAGQRISAEEGIKAYTSGGAYTSFEENIKGRIVPGQFADLVILAEDPTTINPDKISDIKIITTLVGGKIAYQSN